LLAVRFFVSLQKPDLGFPNVDVVIIFIPLILIIFWDYFIYPWFKKTE